MKILMVSAGLPPKRWGGLPLYVQHLRQQLARRGHQITYLATDSTGQHGRPGVVQPRDSVPEFSLISPGNSLLWEGVPLPLSDVRASRRVRKSVLEFVNQVNPDIIHIHEILCFPLELVSLLRARGHRLIFTTQDYSAICPTIRLFKHDQKLCTLRTQELQCETCIRKWYPSSLRPITRWLLRTLMGTNFDTRLTRAALRRFGGILDRIAAPVLYRGSLYRQRRVEVERHLNAFNLILCMSQLQRDLISNIVDHNVPIRHIYLSLPTYRKSETILRGTDSIQTGTTIRFGALNVDQVVKGRLLLLEEFRALRELKPNVELHFFGHIKGDAASGVFYHGEYDSSDLDDITSMIDVGVIPSLWPEAYGYVGPEMLTRGVPLIVSSAGAMTEYVIPYFNGLHFDPLRPGALRDAMYRLASDPALLSTLRANAPASSLGIKSFSEHVDEMESIYEQLVSSSSADRLSRGERAEERLI